MTLPDYPKEPIQWFPNLQAELLHALGRITAFATGVEEALHLVYWKESGVGGVIGRRKTQKWPASRVAKDILEEIEPRADDPRIQDFKLLIGEYRGLASKRNKCVHWAWRKAENGRTSLVPPAYHAENDPTSFSIAELVKISDDLTWLQVRLIVHLAAEENIRWIWKASPMAYTAVLPRPGWRG